jgi:hypothetical protein
MNIYRVGGTEHYVSLTDPASVRQIITALKNEGLVKRNCRYSSFSSEIKVYDNMRLIFVSHSATGHEYILWPCE